MSELSPSELLTHVDEVLVDVWTDEVRDESLAHNRLAPKVMEQIRELGWAGLAAPEDVGGIGLNPSELLPVFQRLGQRLVAGPLFEYLVVPGLLLEVANRHPVPDAIREVLVALTTLDARIAVVDPAASQSADLSIGSVQASPARLDGQVDIVRGAADATHLIVHAEQDGQPVVAVVPSSSAGVSIEERPSTDPGMDICRVRLQDVTITDDDVAWSGPVAAQVWADILAWARAFTAAELTGMARHLHDLSVDYTSTRKQFGRPVGSFQTIQHLAADNARRVVMIEALCEATAQDADDAQDSSRRVAAATFKALASEFSREVAQSALQMHGGIGFTQEYQLHWYFKRVLSLHSWYGNHHELAREIGRSRLAAA